MLRQLWYAFKCIKSISKANRGVEGLPLKYAIIVLVAAIVIGVAIYMATTLGEGVTSATDTIADVLNNTLNESMGGL